MIAYDISDNRKRRNVCNLLLDHGQRVQYSVFECRLKKKQQQRLRQSLSQIIAPQDSIRWYPLCNWCEAAIRWQGTGNNVATDQYHLL